MHASPEAGFFVRAGKDQALVRRFLEIGRNCYKFIVMPGTNITITFANLTEEPIKLRPNGRSEIELPAKGNHDEEFVATNSQTELTFRWQLPDGREDFVTVVAEHYRVGG